MFQLLLRFFTAATQFVGLSDLSSFTQDISPMLSVADLPPFSNPLETPEFDDILLGRLIVSKENFPFLTPKDSPEAALIYPTVNQLDVINAAVGGRKELMRRAAGEGADLIDVSVGIIPQWVFDLVKFLEGAYSYEVLNSTVVDPGSLPFDKIQAGEYFQTVQVKNALAEVFVQKLYEKLKDFSANGRPWVPAKALVMEMDICTDVDFNQATNKDFMSVFSISVYDNDFKFHPIEHVETIVKAWRFLWWSSRKVEIRRWYEPRYLTQDEWGTLMDFMLSDFAVRLRREYRHFFEQAGIHIHDD
ncbi:hypothetical protein PRIPAC_75284 [Pristionchus pacificus]|uniref:Uncharacterized protein n=1 Tax=Pristionchus pacificus TaxID=54126 RepID=A0A2A6BZJ7_PRIPA|nr:hypothetical protein PRIPAC_75284 [Pristionchus pacificus]|eukprot:PDM71345.1 hypothetical protein PRIPAC_37752 [Pristionchus pacificus]